MPIIVNIDMNDCIPAYNVYVSINSWGTGEQYDIDETIEAIE